MQTTEDMLHSRHLAIDLVPLGLGNVDKVWQPRVGLIAPAGVIESVGSLMRRNRVRGRRDGWGEEGRIRGRDGGIKGGDGNGDGDGGFRRRRATVGAGEVALDAVSAGHVTIAADFARTAGQAGLAFARSAADGIRRHF